MRLALGTAQFGLPYGIANQGGQVSRAAAASILNLARQSGIDTLDTAVAYGDSEVCLGEVGADGFKIITKLPAIPDSCDDVAAWVTSQMRASLERLGRPSVYGLLLHRPQQLAEARGKELARALRQLKDDGLVTKIGVSTYSPTELEIATTACPIDLVQAPFNLVDRRLLTSGWLDRLYQNGVEIHTRSAFLQGLLLMSRTGILPRFNRWSALWNKWHEWLAKHGVSASEACLAFPLSFAQISRVVVGVDTVEQLAQLIEAESLSSTSNLPDLACNDEQLINPSYWNSLEPV